jgi:hypothetical protein
MYFYDGAVWSPRKDAAEAQEEPLLGLSRSEVDKHNALFHEASAELPWWGCKMRRKRRLQEQA